MLSIQEITSKASSQIKAVAQFMDSHGYYDPYQCNRLWNEGLKRSIQRELHETIHHLSLKEFLTKGAATGFTGTAGSNYLTAAVLCDKIFTGISTKDRAASIAAGVVMEPMGETINVATSFTKAYKMGDAGHITPQAPIINQSAITYDKYKCALISSYDMMEDSGFSLIDLAAENAGRALVKQTNDQICAVLARTTGTTGMGDKTTAAAGADTTTPAQIATCAAQVAAGAVDAIYRPDTLIITPEAWYDAVSTTATQNIAILPPRTADFDAWMGGAYDVIILNSMQLGTDITANRLTNAKTIVLEKALGIVVARKAWMRIENYADPAVDLQGAVVTAKQACGELVDAAIGVLTET